MGHDGGGGEEGDLHQMKRHNLQNLFVLQSDSCGLVGSDTASSPLHFLRNLDPWIPRTLHMEGAFFVWFGVQTPWGLCSGFEGSRVSGTQIKDTFVEYRVRTPP